jgi:hypothetical protein
VSVTREELLAALRRRIDAEDGGGRGWLFGHLATERGVDPEVLHALGVFHWAPAAVAAPHDPVAEREADGGLAAVLLLPVVLTSPETLPGAARASFAAAEATPGP